MDGWKLAKPPAVVPGRSGKSPTVTFLSYPAILEGRCLLQTMQELSGTIQMTLLIIVLSLSALVGPRYINSHWKANE